MRFRNSLFARAIFRVLKSNSLFRASREFASKPLKLRRFSGRADALGG